MWPNARSTHARRARREAEVRAPGTLLGMYRAETKPLTCPVCQGVHLSPETLIDPTEGVLQVQFAKRDVEASFFGEDKRLRLRIDRARVCLGCGYVLPFLSSARIEKLRTAAPTLEPVPGSED
jgi:hypothetical protein